MASVGHLLSAAQAGAADGVAPFPGIHWSATEPQGSAQSGGTFLGESRLFVDPEALSEPARTTIAFRKNRKSVRIAAGM
jgi:hypothetical protein